MPFRACREDGRMLVNAKRAKGISAAAATTTGTLDGSTSACGRGGIDGVYALVHPNIPELDFATATAAYELALATTLKVNVCYPLTVLFPDFNHCH